MAAFEEIMEAYRSGCESRLERIAAMRALPGLTKSDDWEEEIEAIRRVQAGLDAGSIEDLDPWDWLQLRIGLETMLLNRDELPTASELAAHLILRVRTDDIE